MAAMGDITGKGLRRISTNTGHCKFTPLELKPSVLPWLHGCICSTWSMYWLRRPILANSAVPNAKFLAFSPRSKESDLRDQGAIWLPFGKLMWHDGNPESVDAIQSHPKILIPLSPKWKDPILNRFILGIQYELVQGIMPHGHIPI
jgi:hypothetical protein